jgi:pimeloyl-ACP methyl ester carboxylesterase
MQYFILPDGTRLAYADQGAGTVLLCLPGLTRTMQDFGYVLPHLSGRVIRMDYRGRGLSSWTGAASYNVVQEAQDALALMDHLGVERFAVLGTSRGGLIGLVLAHLARARLLGLCFNDIGPVIERAGLERISTYVGRSPSARSHEAFAAVLEQNSPGFAGVSAERWLEEAKIHTKMGISGLQITYDPALRESFLASMAAPPGDAWPLFDACAGMPMAVIRGENSDLLSAQTVAEMALRHPGLISATVPDRAHVPFLDEPEALDALRAFQEAVG